jgi:hypothetical protein
VCLGRDRHFAPPTDRLPTSMLHIDSRVFICFIYAVLTSNDSQFVSRDNMLLSVISDLIDCNWPTRTAFAVEYCFFSILEKLQRLIRVNLQPVIERHMFEPVSAVESDQLDEASFIIKHFDDSRCIDFKPAKHRTFDQE